jgi:hypothetical protein
MPEQIKDQQLISNVSGELERLGYLLTQTLITDENEVHWIKDELDRIIKKWYGEVKQ